MDAQQFTSTRGFMRPLTTRILEAWLAVVLAAGLWQGYGAWWMGSRGGDVF